MDEHRVKCQVSSVRCQVSSAKRQGQGMVEGIIKDYWRGGRRTRGLSPLFNPTGRGEAVPQIPSVMLSARFALLFGQPLYSASPQPNVNTMSGGESIVRWARNSRPRIRATNTRMQHDRQRAFVYSSNKFVDGCFVPGGFSPKFIKGQGLTRST
mgnify:CR=1 FL=1